MAETPEVNQRDLWITSPAHSYSSPLASRLPEPKWRVRQKLCQRSQTAAATCRRSIEPTSEPTQ